MTAGWAPDLYQPEAPEDLVAEARAFVADAPWKTSRDESHSYTMWVRLRGPHPELVTGYNRLVSLIEHYGYWRRWFRREYRSVDLDGWSLWLMGNAPGEMSHGIVNRKPAATSGFGEPHTDWSVKW